MVLFLIGTLYDSDAHLDACCHFSTSSLHDLSTWWGYIVCFCTGKAWLWWGNSLPLMKGDWLNFIQPSKVPSRGNSLMSAAVTSLTIGTEMLVFVFDKWLEICFFMVPSIRVARLLAYCVLIGSLAELYLAFCIGMCWHVADGWSYHWQGDIINDYRLGFKSPLQYLTLFMV